MKLNYRQRLFLYFATIFTIFTIGIVVFEQSIERKQRTKLLEERLDTYAEVVNAALLTGSGNDHLQILEDLEQILPQNIRITTIEGGGKVLFDTFITDPTELQDHANRPEIVDASKNNIGTNIRTSASTSQEYLYYAKKFGNRYIRVALPYNVQTQLFLKSDNTFLYFILPFFAVMLILINVVTSRFGRAIKQLRDSVINPDKKEINGSSFPEDELGEIGRRITENYHQLKESRRAINTERDKLLQHVHSSEEGICFFSVDRRVEFYNGLFIQYLNTLTDEPNSEPHAVLSDEIFGELTLFLSNPTATYHETQIQKQGRIFSLRINIFEDKGFEVILNDITKREKTRQLKREMTSNIAHELRTPVTSIRGYLETALEQPLDEQKKRYFITQAFNQTIILSELIQDMGLITKMEEAPQSFQMEEVNIYQILERLKSDLSALLSEKGIDMEWSLPKNLTIKGNYNLIYSIFRNLTDNVIHYAGEGVKIHISQYSEDRDYYYFSFYDTGVGIPDESHLTRLFERFYRINEGRTRDTGGTGLGLSIVRNAIAFHRGSIAAKNRREGGLEFLFQLHK